MTSTLVQRNFPRSFLKLLVAGFLLFALPLAGALMYSAWNTERLAEQAQNAVFNAAQAARGSRALVNRISSIERIARQSSASADPELVADYARVQRNFKLVSDELSLLQVDAEGVRQRMTVLLCIALAVALAIALALTRLIARPIRELDAAIRQLGSADFSRPIRVKGPDDLQFLGERLDWLRRRLTALEAQKNRFLRHVSHELKTPLTALREGAELLHDGVGGALSPQQHKVVGILRENSIRLQGMIEELLDYQRALHAAATLERQPVALETLLREVADAHMLEAEAKHQTVALAAAPACIDADGEKLRTVFDNLVGNALKFTPEGGRIDLVLSERAESVRIEVIDTGPGVPTEERRSIFDSFFRGRAKSGGRVEGSGLGLAIAREFVQAHGGTIGVASDTHGSRFSVVLPRHAGAAT
jgi:two-component system sensor histidine kinase GlrK